jgi:hypothetical protein
MTFDYRMLAAQHLLGTVLLTALTLFLSLRIPERGAERWLRATLLLEALAGLAAVPMLFGETPKAVVRLALALFAAAAVGFVLFAAMTLRERWRAMQSRTPKL